MFRLDLIADNKRTTFLTYGKTGEMFLYRPYSCEQINETRPELQDLARLFLGYPIDQSNEKGKLVYGIGPLWLRTKSIPSTNSFSEASNPERSLSYLSNLNQYTISFLDKTIEFKLRYYFSTAISEFVDTIEWVENKSGGDKVTASSRITYSQLDPLVDAPFKLPVGYGCVRASESNKPLIDTGLIILHDGSPNQAFFDITTSIPIDGKGHDWMSYRYSVDVLKGMSALEVKGQPKLPYLVTLQQGRDLDTSRVKRVKKVWWAPGQSVDYNVYTMDLNSNQCDVEFTNTTEFIDLIFPYNNLDMSGVRLSVELLSKLFSDTSSYHLIDEGDYTSAKLFKNLILERRFDQISLAHGSEPVWVSVVKKISTYSQYMEPVVEPEKDYLTLLNDYQSTLTIFFFTPNYAELQGKAVIDLISDHDVDFSYLMEETNVSPCFGPEQHSDIIIKYPIDSVEVFEALQKKERFIKSQVHLDILSRHLPIIPIQVSDVRVNFDLFNLYIELSLLDLPLTHTYERKRGFYLEYTSKDRIKFIEMLASSVHKCSSYCAHYDCYNFAYNSTSRSCTLGVSKAADSFIKPSDFDSTVYSFVDDLRSTFRKDLPHYLSANNIVDLIKEITESKEVNEKSIQLSFTGLAPLTVKVPLKQTDVVESKVPKPSWITLSPSSIESEADNFNELEKIDTGLTDGEAAVINSTGSMKTSYIMLFEGREFDQTSTLYEDLTYDECVENSEDFDGRSFSYCESGGRCGLTNLHKEDEIKKRSKPNLKCNIYSLDYLSKFDRYDDVTLPNKFKQVTGGLNARDCANQCMDQRDFNCQGFYYCVGLPEQASDWCYMTQVHLTDLVDRSRLGHTSEHKYNCDFYSRSYLAQFDAYYGKAIGTMNDDPNTKVFKGLTAEEYAKMCVQSSCLAFDVCPERRAIFFKHKTRFADREIKKTHLIDSKGCVTFVLSDKSQYNYLKRSEKIMINREPDKKASVDAYTNQAENSSDIGQSGELASDVIALLDDLNQRVEPTVEQKSQLFAKLLSIVVGAAIGSLTILTWNELYARGCLDKLRLRIMPSAGR